MTTGGIVAAEVAAFYGVTVEDLVGPSKLAHILRARVALYRALKENGWSPAAIGKFVGGRDRTTVLKVLNPSPSRRRESKRHWLGAAGPYVDGRLAETASARRT